jgi:transposase
MLARKRYSREFKDAVVKKILNRGDRTVLSVCEEAGVSKASTARWIEDCGNLGANPSPRGRMKRTAEAKLKAVVDISNLAESEVGAYLRREGLYSNQVAEWRAEIVEYFETKPKFAKDERDEKIKNLEHEVLRKDKALAEASALLILQKKVDLIWGNRSGDEK